MLNRDSFKKIHSCQSNKCKDPLSVLFAFFPNMISSLHILDTEIFFWVKTSKMCLCQMLSSSESYVLWTVGCAALPSFTFLPLTILFKNSQRETDDSLTKSPHCVPCPLLQPWACCSSNSFAFPFDSHKSTFRFFQTLQCIKHYSRWCFLTMPFYTKQHFAVYAALSKNQTCNYANMYAFIIIKFYCKWLMHINLIL